MVWYRAKTKRKILDAHRLTFFEPHGINKMVDFTRMNIGQYWTSLDSHPDFTIWSCPYLLKLYFLSFYPYSKFPKYMLPSFNAWLFFVLSIYQPFHLFDYWSLESLRLPWRRTLGLNILLSFQYVPHKSNMPSNMLVIIHQFMMCT
jgi:hypothetical protein